MGAKQTGDVAAIYAAARESVVSIKTNERLGHRASSSTPTARSSPTRTWSAPPRRVQVQFADDETAPRQVAGVDRSSRPGGREGQHRAQAQGALARRLVARSGPGQLAVAIGSPFGLSQTTTAGIVSGTGRHIQAPDGFQIDSVIQTDAPINPGNSGGPLLDAKGRVIGVNSQIASQSGGSVGIGFAVPSNTVRDVIPRLERGETIKRAYLGVSTSGGNGGVTVAAVSAGAPGRDGRAAGRRRDQVRRRQEGHRPRRRRGRDPGPPPGRDASRS